ncbi:hypothetical protein KC327_g62 [Hortaea werneckii]|nr:hypothetical protein KC327_g62 [Hortaea werneckii]
MLPFCILLLAACVEQTRAAVQRRIELKYPPPRISSTETTVIAGDVIRFRWETSWPTVTVQLWQGPNKKGSMSHMNLLTNEPNTTTNVGWTVHVLPRMSREPPLYLYIFNPNDTSCQACSQNSSDFYIRGKESPGSGEEGGPVKLGLGIGLGLGLPLVCVTVAIVWLWIGRRRRRVEGGDRESQAEPLRDWRQQPSPMSTETWTRCYGALARANDFGSSHRARKALRQPKRPIAHSKPTPAPPRIPVGASKKAAPLATDPMAVPLTAATIAPTAAYFAYRTRRQNMKIVAYLKLRKMVLVRRWVGWGPYHGRRMDPCGSFQPPSGENKTEREVWPPVSHEGREAYLDRPIIRPESSEKHTNLLCYSSPFLL